MENEPEQQVEEKKPGWFRRMALWKKVLLGFAVLFAVLFLNALFLATRPGGFRGTGTTMSERMKMRGGAPGLAAPTEMARQAGPQYEMAEDRAVEVSAQTAGGTPMLPLDTWGRQLILNASIKIEVSDVRAAFDHIQTVAASEGALVTSANLTARPSTSEKDSDDYGHATLVLRMPQSRFHTVRRRLLAVAGDLDGKVLRDDVSSEDVTEQYVDLKSRLRHWQAQEVQLLRIMDRADSISDVLNLRNQLAPVQQQIERISGQLRFLENRVDLSTITITVSAKKKGPVEPTFANLFKKAGKDIAAAWTKALLDVVGIFGQLAIWITYLLPFAVILGLIWLPIRSARRRALQKPPA
ncbi:MAG: DUF4349 domain-containing protein [Armatimonadetes bacterium]|nr:DUF4349 domain-containing protein [Armatimonadota bacterium]NIM23045.1 DUF4349 domain-containing protein [Armatimonadota bacterium]NIM66913.1 DUF4349 domain-containing protein [Armatimonadota bacterium]NIM75447.1 DUF4349 domain-containing protein [Armatimonadota bacterium]NIN05104.1 DUF4349 domain-containing protein [Armatimonadota bacterium]